MKDRHRLW